MNEIFYVPTCQRFQRFMRRPGDGYVAMLVATFGFEPNEEENTRARRKELRAEERRLTRYDRET